MVTILLTEDQFAIEQDGEQGEFADYGDIATLTADDGRYIAVCDDPDGEAKAFRLTSDYKLAPESTTTEDVELSADVEEEDEEPE